MFDLFKEVLRWLKDLLLWLPRKMWQLFTDGLATIIEAIPVPDFMENLGNLFAAIPSGVAYFLAPMHLGAGVTIVLSAYVIRFVIRRIPLIG